MDYHEHMAQKKKEKTSKIKEERIGTSKARGALVNEFLVDELATEVRSGVALMRWRTRVWGLFDLIEVSTHQYTL